MNTTAENITFIIVRGVIALAMVGLGFYCLAQGIHFFMLPRAEAQQIHIHFVGLDITANGLGAVIFGTGLGFCYVGKRTAPTRIQTTSTSETHPAQEAATQPAASVVRAATPPSDAVAAREERSSAVPPATPRSGSVRTSEGVTIMEAPSKNKMTFD